ncbi:hypothetical protein GC169_04450 [bacterium]|nr:hypothetical protein [bacterium]
MRQTRRVPRPLWPVAALALGLAACSEPEAIDYAAMEGGELQGRAEAGDEQAAEELQSRLDEAAAADAELAQAETDAADPEGAFTTALAARDEPRLRALADAGNPWAMFHIALPLTRSADPAEQERGRMLAGKSAESGLPEAQLWIGRAISSGLAGFPADPVRGMRWIEQAAEAGSPEAMFSAAQLYESGPISDPDRARLWYKRAADAGVPAAGQALDRLNAL